MGMQMSTMMDSIKDISVRSSNHSKEGSTEHMNKFNQAAMHDSHTTIGTIESLRGNMIGDLTSNFESNMSMLDSTDSFFRGGPSSSGQKNASWGVVAGTQNASWGVVAGDATTTTTTGTGSTTNGAAAAFGKNMLRTTNLATSRLRGMGGFGASRRASAEHLRSTLIQNKNSNNNMKDISTKSAPPITYNSNSNSNNNNNNM